RLDLGADQLCCVGTSATIGSGPDAAAQLTAFASDVFGEHFDDDSIVGEHRVEVNALVRPADPEARVPGPDALAAAFALESPNDTMARLKTLWLGHDIDDPVAGAEVLRAHPMLRNLLLALAGEPRDVDTLAEQLLAMDSELQNAFAHADADALRQLVGGLV